MSTHINPVIVSTPIIVTILSPINNIEVALSL